VLPLLLLCCLCCCCAASAAAAAALCSYRTSVEEVPVSEYTIPLGQAQLLREGSDITLIGWGAQVGSSAQ
jgi:transketolase C-terminal domain/subunit